MRKSPARPSKARAAIVVLSAALAWSSVVLPAMAQTKGAQQAPAPQPRVIVVPNDIYRGPPAPAERYVAPPRSSQEISPSMPRPEALPQMTPRVGN